MSNDKKFDLDGEGFSKEPLSPEELAKHRHLHHHYTRHFIEADKFVEKLGLGWIVKFSQAAPTLVKFLAGAMALSAALAYMAERGWF